MSQSSQSPTTIKTELITSSLREQVLRLLNELVQLFPDETDIMWVLIYLSNSDMLPDEKLMNSFIKWVYPWKQKIHERDETFFTENDHVFGPLPADKVRYFKILFVNGMFKEEDKQALWNYFDVFIACMDQYLKLAPMPPAT